ncbi:MAG: hypothetical protein GC136_01310 [Alphaproteobacteria bacterium]|nr:hypothetical protein [Alphaproteobacteria bacterium]
MAVTKAELKKWEAQLQAVLDRRISLCEFDYSLRTIFPGWKNDSTIRHKFDLRRKDKVGEKSPFCGRNGDISLEKIKVPELMGLEVIVGSIAFDYYPAHSNRQIGRVQDATLVFAVPAANLSAKPIILKACFYKDKLPQNLVFAFGKAKEGGVALRLLDEPENSESIVLEESQPFSIQLG